MYKKVENYNKQYSESIEIDIGCSSWKKEGFIGINNCYGENQKNIPNGGKSIDINHDLSSEISFENYSVEEIFASHLMKHTDLDFMLKKINKVVKSGAKFECIVPYTNNVDGVFSGHNVSLPEKLFKQKIICKNVSFEYILPDEWKDFRKYIF